MQLMKAWMAKPFDESGAGEALRGIRKELDTTEWRKPASGRRGPKPKAKK
jgi:hypothetical protein